jgi:hypothetical protein
VQNIEKNKKYLLIPLPSIYMMTIQMAIQTIHHWSYRKIQMNHHHHHHHPIQYHQLFNCPHLRYLITTNIWKAIHQYIISSNRTMNQKHENIISKIYYSKISFTIEINVFHYNINKGIISNEKISWQLCEIFIDIFSC